MTRPSPPASVAVSAWLLMGYGILSLLRIWLFGRGLPSSLAGIATWALALMCFALLARAIYRGRNEARWLVTALVAGAVVLLPIYKPGLPSGPHLGLYILQFIMPIAAAALLFTPGARGWFQRTRIRN